MTNTNQKKRIREIIILISITLLSFFLWDTFILFPIKLFVVFLHEASHVFAAVLTGGSAIRMEIGFDLGGRCELSGGNQFIISSAGYLGSFLFGSLLFYSSFSKTNIRWSFIILTIVIVLFAVNLIANPIIQIASIIFSCCLLFSMKYAPYIFNKYLIETLGLISCLYVIYDIKQDILTQTANQSDATIIASITGINEMVWGVFWLLISASGLVLLFRNVYNKSGKDS